MDILEGTKIVRVSNPNDQEYNYYKGRVFTITNVGKNWDKTIGIVWVMDESGQVLRSRQADFWSRWKLVRESNDVLKEML